MFLFLAIAMAVVVGAVTLAVVGGGDSAALPDVAPEQLVDPLPATRPVGRADVEALRLPVAPRGYRMADVDDVLGRLGAELAERDARIAELEAALAGAKATAVGGPEMFAEPGADGADRTDPVDRVGMVDGVDGVDGTGPKAPTPAHGDADEERDR